MKGPPASSDESLTPYLEGSAPHLESPSAVSNRCLNEYTADRLSG